MTKAAYKTVDEYLDGQPGQFLPMLIEVRETLRSALPNADESIMYNLPVYKINGKVVIFFAGWKNHYSLYPASAALLSAFQEELSEVKVVKSTLQFSYKNPVPLVLIGQIAEFRSFETSNV